ncbi:unnamed protein product [Bursaphelenchus okinawaensis]|uniref:Uncharacterized protein n=1 Tax=Bursaphelenchus okinawaensis TaxID=465554 RepID=A0A811JV27_9BILA|nr:unnamed protein product [Bursaphelenchus okinawaensis]CAG9084401.1 unnamed protein product [Bursaphelenchus okinawaensis]
MVQRSAWQLLILLLIAVCATVHADRQWSAGVGLWGKRSYPLLRKRSPDFNPNIESNLWDKRAQWQAANGLWGKRSAPPVPQYAPWN